MKFISDLIIRLLKRIEQIFKLIEKVLSWIMSKIPFLDQALKFIEKLVAQVITRPFKQCSQQTNFKIGTMDVPDLLKTTMNMAKKRKFGLPFINKILPNFGSFINCLRNQVRDGINRIKNVFKVAEILKFSQQIIGES